MSRGNPSCNLPSNLLGTDSGTGSGTGSRTGSRTGLDIKIRGPLEAVFLLLGVIQVEQRTRSSLEVPSKPLEVSSAFSSTSLTIGDLDLRRIYKIYLEFFLALL
jgi:hypothetical protein